MRVRWAGGWGRGSCACLSSLPALPAALELRAARSRDAKLSGQEKPSPEVGDTGGMGWGGGAQLWHPTLPQGPPCVQAPAPAKPLHPLLEEARQHQGSMIMPGNRALLNLNLTCE